MQLPFRALHVFPVTLCASPACLGEVLEQPLVQRTPVYDTIGIEYAFDVQITQGFYVVVLSYVALTTLRALIIAIATRARRKD